MSYSYGTGPYTSSNYPAGQGTQYQSQNVGIFGNPNRQETQGSYIKDSPKRTIFGGNKGDTRSFYDDYSGAQSRSPPRTLASNFNFQTKPSGIAEYENMGPEKRSPNRSVTPNNPTRQSNLGNEYQLRINDGRPSQEPVFSNPIFSQQAGAFSRDHTDRNYKAGAPDLEIKKTPSQKAFSAIHTEHGDAFSVKSHQVPPQQSTIGQPGHGVPSRGFGLSQTPSSSGPLPRPSTVVQMDPLAKLNHPTHKMPYFSDKRVVITGASSGIGRAIAMWYVYQLLYSKY